MGKKRFSCSWTNTWQALHESLVFTLEEEGALHRLQSYIFYRDNTVIDHDTGFPMTRKQIAAVLGLSEKQAGRILDSLRAKNAIITTKNGRGNNYVINPCLFWKGTERDKEYLSLYDTFFKERKNMCKSKSCPFFVAVSGRVIPIWDINVPSKGQKCPLSENLLTRVFPDYFGSKSKDDKKNKAATSGL